MIFLKLKPKIYQAFLLPNHNLFITSKLLISLLKTTLFPELQGYSGVNNIFIDLQDIYAKFHIRYFVSWLKYNFFLPRELVFYSSNLRVYM